MNKKKILIVFIIIIIVIISVLIINNKNNNNKLIENYLIKNGFVKDEASTLYEKQISDINLKEFQDNTDNNIESTYEVLYFNTYDNKLTKNLMDYINNLLREYTAEYNYVDKSVEYNYRLRYEEMNLLLEGTYKKETDDFTCDIIYAYNIESTDTKSTICDKLKNNATQFYYEAETLFKSSKIRKYITNID